MRMRRLFWLLAFAAGMGGATGLAACALVTGLIDYSEGTLDASKARDGQGDPAAPPEDDTGTADANNANDANVNDDGNVEAQGADADAQLDARATDDADGANTSDSGPVDASDGAPSVDANDGAPPDASDGGCSQVVHFNGVGQTYASCAPLDTYGADEAAKACASADAGPCEQNALLCIGGPTVECTKAPPNTCTCWSYTSGTAGHVRVSNAGVVCQCPAVTDLSLWH